VTTAPPPDAVVAADYLATLGARVRSAREARGLSYRQAATVSGVGLGTLHDVEHGADVRVTTAVRLLDWIGSDPRR
jgi:transcriptional regulator with XRE-family HTH domain